MLGLIVGVYVAIEKQTTVSMIYLLVLSIVILVSMVFKIISVMKSVNDYKTNVSQSSVPDANISTYLSKDPLDSIPSEYVELDISKEMKQAECDSMKEEFEPTAFVDGKEASDIMDKCTSACMKHAKCSLVVMPNVNGKNNECKFYGLDDGNASYEDETKTSLEALNNTTEVMKATHYASVHKL
jgi:hypothetical protein